MAEPHRTKGTVELFPRPGGWHFVRVPKRITAMYSDRAARGLIPIDAAVGGSTWKTSLLPMGDGTHFIALNAKVRKREEIGIGSRVSVTFRVR